MQWQRNEGSESQSLPSFTIGFNNYCSTLSRGRFHVVMVDDTLVCIGVDEAEDCSRSQPVQKDLGRLGWALSNTLPIAQTQTHARGSSPEHVPALRSSVSVLS